MSFLTFLAYMALKIWALLMFMMATFPLPLGLGLLARYFQKHELESYTWIFALPILLWLYGIHWMASHTATKMIIHNTPFGSATKASWHEARMYLAFLPLIGGWFVSKGGKDDVDEKDSS